MYYLSTIIVVLLVRCTDFRVYCEQIKHDINIIILITWVYPNFKKLLTP
jgi:hypothetical protein